MSLSESTTSKVLKHKIFSQSFKPKQQTWSIKQLCELLANLIFSYREKLLISLEILSYESLFAIKIVSLFSNFAWIVTESYWQNHFKVFFLLCLIYFLPRFISPVFIIIIFMQFVCAHIFVFFAIFASLKNSRKKIFFCVFFFERFQKRSKLCGCRNSS